MILTCSSPTSRNMKYGFDLAQNKNNKNIPLVEGLYALKSAKYLSDLNICNMSLNTKFIPPIKTVCMIHNKNKNFKLM